MIKNVSKDDVVEHAKQFPMFFVRATPERITLEEEIQAHIEVLQPLKMNMYVEKFKPLSLSHIY